MRVWLNDGSGVMNESSTVLGLTDTGAGRGLLTFDYDNDGDLDLFLVNNAGAPVLYRNHLGNEAGWLRVTTVGVQSNPHGLGAVVRLWVEGSGPVQIREIDGGSNFLGQNEPTAYFGLGEASNIDRVEVFWPMTGRVVEFTDVPRNTSLSVVETTSALDLPGAPELDASDAPACGLLGIEVLLPLAARRLRLRRRSVS